MTTQGEAFAELISLLTWDEDELEEVLKALYDEKEKLTIEWFVKEIPSDDLIGALYLEKRDVLLEWINENCTITGDDNGNNIIEWA